MAVIVLVGLFFAALTLLCLHMRIGSRAHRTLTRAVCAVWLMMLLSLIPGFRVGINALTVACVGVLGLPGLGMLEVILLLR